MPTLTALRSPGAARRMPTSTGCTCWCPTGSCWPTCPSPTWCCGRSCRTGPAGSCWPRCARRRPHRLPRRHRRARSARRGRGRSWTRPCRNGGSAGKATRNGRPGVPVRHETIPVISDGRVIAVIERSTNLSSARTPSRLDLAYLKAADDLAQMVAAGLFPRPGEEPTLVRSPRVGDGLLRLSRSGKVTYASPNALSAYRRLGLTADLVGAGARPADRARCARPGEPRDDSLMLTASGQAHMETEVEGNGSVVQLRTIPLVVDGAAVRGADPAAGRDRAAAPGTRADHQGRHHPGDPPPGQEQPADRGRAAAAAGPPAQRAPRPGRRWRRRCAGSGRSRSCTRRSRTRPDEVVDFDDIAGRVAMMAGGGVGARGAGQARPVAASSGMLPAAVATPLALVLTELLQNALQHGLTARRRGTGAARQAAGHGASRGTAAHGDGGRQRRRPARGLRPGFGRPAWACRSCARWSSRNWAAGWTVAPQPGGGTMVLVELPVESLAPRARRWSTGARTSERPPLEAGPVGDRSGVRAGPGRARRGACAPAARPRSGRPRRRSPGRSPAPTAGTTPSRGSAWHTCLASSIWSSAGPVLPIGKNSSGSSSRHAAW